MPLFSYEVGRFPLSSQRRSSEEEVKADNLGEHRHVIGLKIAVSANYVSAI